MLMMLGAIGWLGLRRPGSSHLSIPKLKFSPRSKDGTVVQWFPLVADSMMGVSHGHLKLGCLDQRLEQGWSRPSSRTSTAVKEADPVSPLA